MPLLPKRIFVTDYLGLCNRLEAMTMAFAIQARHGHEICVDWPQLDALEIDGVVTRSPGVLSRVGLLRLHTCTREEFERLGRWRNIYLRGPEGPDAVLDPLFLPTARRVRLRPAFARVVDAAFTPFAGRPVAGVHIRRGDFTLADPGGAAPTDLAAMPFLALDTKSPHRTDFTLADEDTYDVNASRFPAVPTWWYEAMMARLVARQPDTAFLLSCTGDSEEFRTLKKNFDVFEAQATSAYPFQREGHQARGNPVTDLFALSRCSVLLATPRSTFSHYPANALGEPTICVLPARQMSRRSPGFGVARLYGRRAPAWFQACRDGLGVEPGSDANLPEVLPAGNANPVAAF